MTAAFQDPRIITHDDTPTAVVRDTVPMSELRTFFDSSFGAVAEVIAQSGQQPGPAFAHYFGEPGEVVELEAGFITSQPLTGEHATVLASQLPGGEVATATHVGSYDSLGASWGALAGWITEQGRALGATMWEVYVTMPTPDGDPATMRTDLFWPLAD